jgi:glucose/mannose-6-phosphate isomerase
MRKKMELDDLERMQQLDPEDMIGLINGLPDQLATAWDLGQTLPLPKLGDLHQVVVVGMGGSAIGADLLAAYAEPMLAIPLIVQRGYSLPAWAAGPETLVICSSHSGNTEETISGYHQAKQRGCSIIAVTTGGKLGELATKAGDALWQFAFDSQPRAAVGYSFGLLLAIFSRLKLIPSPAGELAGAIKAMKQQQKDLLPDISVPRNPAKRTAGQLIERCTTVWASGLLAPVARRWKTQINENADTHASFELLPEANHNTLQGIVEPAKHFGGSMHVFLYAAHDEERNRLRVKLTKETLMVNGQNTDLFKAQGKNRLENLLTALHFGDYLSYYLAISYGIDPTPVDMLVSFKEKMKAAQQ